MDKYGAMNVDTNQGICESNQGNPNEGWYQSKNCDTIQQDKTQDQRKLMIRIKIF